MLQQMGQFDPDQSPFAEGKQLFGRWVDELNAEPLIHQDDGGQQVVQECLGVIQAGWHRFLPKTVLYTYYAPIWCIEFTRIGASHHP